jgi:hypothetical protein
MDEILQHNTAVDELRGIYKNYVNLSLPDDDLCKIIEGLDAELYEELYEGTATDTCIRECLYSELSQLFLGSEWPCGGDEQSLKDRFFFALEWLATDRGWQ